MPAQIVRDDVPEVAVTEVARGLRIVWSLRWSPDGRLFIGERPGRLSVLHPGASEPVTYANLPTALGGESGLMGIALHPQFPAQPYVYVMYTARKLSGGVNRISRFVDTGAGLEHEQVLIDDIPASRNHDGGALEFGPDGMLYVGTGDANAAMLAQDVASPNGKVLRIAPDGSIPAGNPFPGSPVWAYGFRNVSGLAFHPETGELWAASHGPSGVAADEPKHMDSVYVVRKGGNHGWPHRLGVSDDEAAMASPVLFYADYQVPPGGMVFYRGAGELHHNLFVTSLRGQELHRVGVEDGTRIARIERWWHNRFGRLRAIAEGPDGSLYVGTSNRDLRVDGDYPESDLIYRLTPAATQDSRLALPVLPHTAPDTTRPSARH
jgi:quinoprotein glucose dehydrogenase